MSTLRPTKLPRFATTILNNGPLGGASVIEPSEIKKDSGWNYSERPPREYFNWLSSITYEWIDYFDKLWLTSGQINFHFNQNLSTTTGLVFGIDAGTVTFDGQESVIASTTLTMTANAITVIGFNLDALTISQYISGGEPTSDFVKLFVVTTNGSAITAVDDRRTPFQVQSRLQSGDNKLIIDGATDTLNYTNNGVSVLYANSLGNIGVNTSSPLGKMHVKQNASGISSISGAGNGLIVEDNNSTGITIATPNTQDGALLFADPESNVVGGMTYQHGGDVLTLRTNDINRFAINNAGDVSISSPATANPLGKLHIKDGSSGVTLGSNKDLVIESNDSTVIQLMSPNTASPAIFFADPEANSAGGLEYSHGAGKMHLRVEDQNRVSLDSAGQMVIANASDTVTPLSKLHVKTGSSGASPISSDGIFVESAGSTHITIGTSATDIGSLIFADTGSQIVGAVQYDNSTDKLHFAASGATKVTVVGSSGNVGVGLSTPFGSLHIREGVSGRVDADPTADTLVIEGSSETGISIITPNNTNANIFFSDTEDTEVGRIRFDHLENTLSLKASNSFLYLDGTGSGSVGVDVSDPQGKLHVFQGESGVASALTDADALILEDSGSTGITIQTPNTANANIVFRDPQGEAGRISFDHTTDGMFTYVQGVVSQIIKQGRVVVGTNPVSQKGKLQVYQDNSGVSAIGSDTSGLVIEHGSSTGIAIATSNVSSGNITFHDPQGESGRIAFDHSTDGLFTSVLGSVSQVIKQNSVIIGANPVTQKGKLQVYQSDSGVTSVSSDADGLLIEDGSGGTGITIATGNTSSGNIRFTDPQSNDAFSLSFNHGGDTFSAQLGGVTKLSISSATTTVTNDLSVTGNLTVNGTTTTINSTTVTVDDKNLEIGSVAVPTDVTADGGGITLKGATDKTINWTAATGDFDVSENWDLASGKSYKINNISVLNGTTLGSGVTASSLTSVGTLSSLVVSGTEHVGGSAFIGATSGTALSRLHVKQGASGVSSVIADGVLVESSGTAGLSIATPNTQVGLLAFADPESTTSGFISYHHTSDTMYVGTASATKMTVDSAGKVLVASSGTALGKLHVKQGASGVSSVYSSADDIIIEGSTASGLSILTPNNSFGYLAFTDPDDVNPGLIEYDHTNNKMNLQTNSSSKVSISNAGKTVITTGFSETVPALGQLHVRQATSGVSSVSNQADGLVIEDSTHTGITICTPDNQAGNLVFLSPNGITGQIQYDHLNNDMSFFTSGLVKAKLNSVGLSIGTGEADAKLDVSLTGTPGIGAITVTQVSDFAQDSRISVGSPLSNFNDGVFIGTKEGSVSAGIGIFRGTAGWDTNLAFYTNNLTGLPQVDQIQEKMRIDHNGNVGVNETSPIAKLHVKEGESGVTPFANTDTLFIEHSSHAGLTIGTPNNSEGSIFFADPESNTQGGMSYSHSFNYLAFRAGNLEGARLEADGDFFLNTGKLGVGVTPSSGKIHSRTISADNTTYIETQASGNPILILSASGASGTQLYQDRATNSFRIKAEGGADRVTVSSAGDLGVGTTGPTAKIHSYAGASGMPAIHTSGQELLLESASNVGMTLACPSANAGHIVFADNNSNLQGMIRYVHSTDSLDFTTAGVNSVSLNNTQQLVVKTGTAASPGLCFNDSGTHVAGLFSPADDIVCISTNSLERFRIGIEGSATFTGDSTSASAVGLAVTNISSPQGGMFTTTQNSTTASHIRCYSSNTNLVFKVSGTGDVSADNSFNGGGADYAEMFEWLDGNLYGEDRRGYSIALVDDKIKVAEMGDQVIGIISVNPSVIGDGAALYWSGMWLRDEFGTKILDEDGNQQYSPEYNPDMEYLPRTERPEWSPVGLMGKLVLRKGQQTAPTWIKLKDINENLELWLVK